MAAAHVGSCSSSARRFSCLKEEEEAEEGGGGAAGLFAGGFFVTGAVEVEGVGSKPADRDSFKSLKLIALTDMKRVQRVHSNIKDKLC